MEEVLLQELLNAGEMELFNEEQQQQQFISNGVLFSTLDSVLLNSFAAENYDESCYSLFGEQEFSPPEFNVANPDPQTFPYSQEDYYSMASLDNAGPEFVYGMIQDPDPEPRPDLEPGGGERKRRSKRITGQPSKNLMAERRRRKRLNDRLSMLRSVVPKITKMDRTSILVDAIDYMKELMQKIKDLQEQMQSSSSSSESDHLSSMNIFKYEKPNEILVRNSPKFDVERRILDTRIEIYCGAKEGALLSTVTTLEGFGMDIQQCVVSCFNDFALQASCLEEVNEMAILDAEYIKQELQRSAGYGGKCL